MDQEALNTGLKHGEMGLNESKGNMYSWVTHTWNTVKGACPHGCSYCYMKRFGKQSELHFDKKELETNLGCDNVIFVGSSCDMFAKDIPENWIIRTLFHAQEYPNNYLYQTKNPARLIEFAHELFYLDRVCTTIETNRFYPKIMGNTPKPEERATAFSKYPFNRFLTIEPVMDFDIDEMIELVKLCNPVQVNIGADSGNNHLPEPSREKLLTFIGTLSEFTQIDQKRNLDRLIKTW